MPVVAYIYKLLLLAAASSFLPLSSAQKDLYLRFSSDGSGFRSVCMHMGYVNLFRQAGLIDETGSRFASMSFASSGAWFSSQFFWSPQFFQGTAMADTPDDLYEFTMKWGLAYDKTYRQHEDVFARGDESLVARVIKEHEVSVYLALEAILDIAAKEINDPDLMKRPANFDNRVPALRNVDFYVGNALNPNSRQNNAYGWFQDSVTYIGPNDMERGVYAVPFAYQYAVKDDRIMWFAGVEDRDLPLRTCASRSSPFFFDFADWADFNLYPDNKDFGNLFVPKSRIPPCDDEGFLSKPFGGGPPTVAQAALTASTLGSEITSRAPSAFAQYFSVTRESLGPGILDLLLQGGLQVLWHLHDNLVNLGLCTQNEGCGIHDAMFSHMNVADSASLGMTIGQHHSIDKADRSRTLKIIYTINTLSNQGSFLQFFNTETNLRTPPAAYHWPPRAGGDPSSSPYASFQIFDSYLDQKMFNRMLTKVEGTFVRYARMGNLTTVANPLLHVEAGQNVDMLVLIINSELPVTAVPLFTIGPEEFGECARSTAASAELLQVIRTFTSN